MWPSIPAYRSFSSVACPSGSKCELPYCIFGHDAVKSLSPQPSPARNASASEQEPDTKRQKLDHSTKEPVVQAGPAQVQASGNAFVGSIMPKAKAANKELEAAQSAPPKTAVSGTLHPPLPRSATRAVSPPATAAGAKTTSNPDVPTPLMPRKLIKEPASFTRRVTMLKALHAYLKTQNDKLIRAVKPEIKGLHLSANQLNKLAVEEEERIAKENPSVYENVLKQRLVKLKGMTPEVWVRERRDALGKENGGPPKKASLKKIDTGLTSNEEIVFLSTLICPQKGLDAHGYVTKLATEEELAEARKVQEAADHWEECDRCSTRFQVFPERREEDGALTSGGQCTHHWGKRIYPKKTKDAMPEPTRLTCCNEPVGSPGCVTHETHVFNAKGSKRLSVIMPFVETPENDAVPPHTAVCFDCEMGYTTNGLEVLRLTVISWPQHRPLVDVLVKPLGHVLDVNTRFSGVTAEQFVNAKPFDPDNPKPVRNDLRRVESPCKARELFLAHVSPTTPVLGHALENDLNTIRLIHPNIIDTVLLYPTRQGLPIRHGLRNLAKIHLGEDIQQGGAAGHDSFEDARTTGELVRFKVKERWKSMKSAGWTISDDAVLPPMPAGAPPRHAPQVPSMVPVAQMAVLEASPGEKRKLNDDEAHEDEPLAKK